MGDEILRKLESIEKLLKAQDTVLTFKEAAEFLDVSRSYLYKLTCYKKIPHFKPRGKRVYFSKNELIEWIKKNPVKTVNDVEQEAEDYINNRAMK